MSDQRAGWLLVIVSAALGAVVCLMAYAEVARGVLESAANAGEAAIALLLAVAPGILMIVALDVIAFVIGKELRIRIVAAAVPVLTIVGAVVVGGIAAERTDPPASAYWAAAGYDLGPFDCAALNSETDVEIQAALDALDHGPVEISYAADDSCAAVLPVAPAMAIGSYVPQLEREGWTIVQNDSTWLQAERSGYAFWVVDCWPDPTRSAVVIFADRYRYGISCPESSR